MRRSSAWIAQRIDSLYRAPALPASDELGNSAVVWYWPGRYRFDGQTFVVYVSGWTEDGVHWSGEEMFPPDHADYHLWRWVVTLREYRRLVDEREVPSIRRIWKRYRLRTGRAHD